MTTLLTRCLCVLFAVSASDKVEVIPRIPDPPPAIDGRIDEWAPRPLKLAIDRPELVVWGKHNWTGGKDLAATIWMGWDNSNLYIAVDVTDDRLCQANQGRNCYRGDHVEVFLDMGRLRLRSQDEGRYYQVGLNPGNFTSTGDPLADIKPEIVTWFPPDASVNASVAAARTQSGYTLEAAIPWGQLGVKNPEEGFRLGVDICPSDTDSETPAQESLASLLPGTWRVRDAGRMIDLVLGDAEGRAPKASGAGRGAGRQLLSEIRIESGKKHEVVFKDTGAADNKLPVLSLSARLNSEALAGGTGVLKLALNGKPLGPELLLNKGQEFMFSDGRIIKSWSRTGYFLYYSPDFEEAEKGKSGYCPIDVPAYRLEFVVGGLLKRGDNVLEIAHAQTRVDNPLVIADMRLEYREDVKSFVQKAKEAEEPPTGPLAVYEPAPDHKVDIGHWSFAAGGAIQFSIGGEKFVVESSFSLPGKGWLKLSAKESKGDIYLATTGLTAHTDDYDLHRLVSGSDECILVEDKFSSKSGENVPIMVRHEVALGERLKSLHLAGLRIPGLSGRILQPPNPTTVALTEKGGFGLMAEDDVFRVHVTSYCSDGRAGIADNSFVLRPKTSYTMRWAIYPLKRPDYYDFVNAARRRLKTNFTIDGSFFFANYRLKMLKWTPKECGDYARNKGGKFICSGLVTPKYKGKYAHGTAFQLIPHDHYQKLFTKYQEGKPDIKTLVYFHCFIDTRDDARELYADSRLIKPDGEQGDYRNPIYPIFVPMEDNTYGPAVRKNVDIILNEVRTDGVYWDELAYSAYNYHYGKPWDGFSADIDPRTHRVQRYKSSVTLLTQPWRLKLAKSILDSGKVLIGNGNPHTATFTDLHFPRFLETGSITNIVKGHLYTPIALGDHLTERNEVDAYRNMLRALDYGAVYYWYSEHIVPTHPTLTSWEFPMTPIEIRQGYIIGRERILTNRSGLFGWGDNSRFEAHVFDRIGLEITDEDKLARLVKAVERDGKRYAEVRIPKGYGVALVRRQQ